MNGILILCVFGLLFSLLYFFPVYSTEDRIFYVDADIYKNGKFVLKEFTVENGEVTDFPLSYGIYAVEIRNDKNVILFKTPFKAEFHVMPFQMNERETEKINLVWRLPFLPDAETFNIYSGNSRIYTTKIADILCVSGNSACPELCSFENDGDCLSKEWGGASTLLGGLTISILILLSLLFFTYRKAT